MSVSTRERTKVWGSHSRPAVEYPYRVVPKSRTHPIPTGDFTSLVGTTHRMIPRHYPVEPMEEDWINNDYGSAGVNSLVVVGVAFAAIGVIAYLITRNNQAVTTATDANVL